MRFDITLYSDLSTDDMARYGRMAEEYDLGGIWIANNTDSRDPFVNFVPLAMQIERMRAFRDAGLNEIALCIYSNPERAIRLIGEHLVPAI